VTAWYNGISNNSTVQRRGTPAAVKINAAFVGLALSSVARIQANEKDQPAIAQEHRT
jgi:hypothetical protein